MKLKKWLCLACVCCLALSLAACGGGGNGVYVQSVKELSGLGGIAPGDKFPGMVVSENVTEIQKDQNKVVAEVHVKEGQDVVEGQELFTYDMDQMKLALDKQRLELEQLKATIDNYKSQIESLKKDEAKAWGSDKLQYTIQIQSLEVDLKEAELNLTAKETEVAQTEGMLANVTVVSPVTGRITGINEEGYDNYGNPLAYITIQQAGSFRIKATLGELQRGGIVEGTRMKIHSRTDENVFWYGTVTLVDYESPSQGNDNNIYIGGVVDSMSSSSKYPFYVELESSEGLLLGQHVYLEVDAGEEETAALAISSAFICYDEDGTAYVWAEKKGKLEKRGVVTGEYNYMLDTIEILQGITEKDYIAFPDPELCVEGASTTRNEPAAEEGGVA
ncbi:MAG: efflux RND transporter periplasmic adaptor subunit [Oscillospiraceae bacterium]|nr:efflux RND transporter periplasmic adaptor subunit [Oscillospiraceae bacterium]